MEKKPEVDGKWVEVDAKDCISMMDEISRSEILVLCSARIELGAADKEKFSKKLEDFHVKYSREMEGMDNKQKSFFLIRKMLID